MNTTAARHRADAFASASAESTLVLITQYAVISSGAVLLSLTEHNFLYLSVAVVACLAHAFAVWVNGRPLLTEGACQALSLAALLFALVQSTWWRVHISYSLGHFLLFVQIILLYGYHSLRSTRLTQVIACFHLLIAALWALGLGYLLGFILCVGSLTGNLIAVEMHASCRSRLGGGTSSVTWQDFLNAYWLPIVGVGAATALFFGAMPRLNMPAAVSNQMRDWVTGYSESVSLREVGLLRQSNEVALRVQFFRDDIPGKPPWQPGTVFMRGASLPLYHEGQWFGYTMAMRHILNDTNPSPQVTTAEFTSLATYLLKRVDVPSVRVLQKVTLESEPSKTIFAMGRPIAFPAPGGQHGGRVVDSRRYERPVHPLSHNLTAAPGDVVGNRYEVLSLVPQFEPEVLRSAGTPSAGMPWSFFWDVPADLASTLDRVIREIDAIYKPATEYDRVRAVMDYLTDTSRFSYTLDLPEYGGKEPTAAFLTQTRRGSCEQFATAFALLLRSWSIPTRLVVGFKNGEFDAEQNCYLFRDRDAHAWVEVFFNRAGWVPFDATPAGTTSVATPDIDRPSLLIQSFHRFSATVVRRVSEEWQSNVVTYDSSRQRKFYRDVVAAAVALSQDATELLNAVWPGLPARGFLDVLLLLLIFTLVSIVLYLAARWLQSPTNRLRRRPGLDKTLRFYETFLAVLRRRGLSRPDWLTPREFAHLAARQIRREGERAEALAEDVHLVTDLYYRVRYAGSPLQADDQVAVRDALARLRRLPRLRGGREAMEEAVQPS